MLSKQEHKIDIIGNIPFISIHIISLLIFWVGFSWVALITCLSLWVIRMFGITAGYHRYFSHRAYKTTRWFQFILAVLGSSSAQLGPLWWAARHRHHHRFADTEQDVHSPIINGFWWSHVGWVMCPKYSKTDEQQVRDLAKYPELKWLNRFHITVPIGLAVIVTVIGILFQLYVPQLKTTALQMLVWGFCLSTLLLYHTTFTINSLAHIFGYRSFNTTDSSRNNWFLALITLGEGWHNNHHYYPASERQGFYWWEIDVTHYILKLLSWLRIVWDLKTPPRKVYDLKAIKNTEYYL
ncbi:delta 9 acyl-lipid fatty acid desaturase [Dulcicalothrix desertica PCC 7102]|jgi:stearoyl-CoA desaturase (Delta-9 desaturase)|uniref:Delta 9 acyl-lipid fatty acid desaturase n=1 Tax=Dulcicalothrix desertica PCC 7102 TaxID=232991 RepID=A0A3S1C7F5_9CYAN|nr:acyl-CoA desaturase [Dulcicalothrix desertica]RUT01727.1 delta 9 acyl-lipid fatty acid desaturase [Dulcicalothrix desertica PCC 7102]TWH42878.1 stearoyl-CoA desaturase (delta-9 desaturase) [Dulcicalothrix desertica PCC 7102]